MHLCMEEFYARAVPIRLNARGLKVYTLDVRKHNTRRITFKDSLNFFMCPLAALPAHFGLEDEVEDKPHFPHLYNQRAHLNVRLDHLPALEYYQVGQLMEKQR
jgi:hypothetical protein